jgi:hypothetical protein
MAVPTATEVTPIVLSYEIEPAARIRNRPWSSPFLPAFAGGRHFLAPTNVDKQTWDDRLQREMGGHIRQIVKDSQGDKTRKHMRQPENAFLYHYAVPIIFNQMKTVEGIGESEAAQSLLSESYRNISYCQDTPARTKGHPSAS